MTKYNSKVTWVGNKRFDSKFESIVYMNIASVIDPTHIQLQPRILIKPATADYRAVYWKADFRVMPSAQYPHYPHLIIEAKGIATRDFKSRMLLFESNNNEDYKRTIIVQAAAKSKKISGIPVIQSDQLTHYLGELCQPQP